MAELTVLGIGNVLMRDDGVGVYLLEAVRAARRWGENVEFIDGGVGGLRLLTVLESAKRLVVFDVADMQLPPGEFRLLGPGQLREDGQGQWSLHEISFAETLRLCGQFCTVPGEVAIMAIQPADVTHGRQLSPTLAGEFDKLVDAAVKLVEGQLHRP